MAANLVVVFPCLPPCWTQSLWVPLRWGCLDHQVLARLSFRGWLWSHPDGPCGDPEGRGAGASALGEASAAKSGFRGEMRAGSKFQSWCSAHFLRRGMADEGPGSLLGSSHLQLLAVRSQGEKPEAGWRDFPSRLPPWHAACPQMLRGAVASLGARCRAAELHLAAQGSSTAHPTALHRGNSLPGLFPKRGRSRSWTERWVRPSPGPFSPSLPASPRGH